MDRQVRSVFEAPTVSGLAERIEILRSGPSSIPTTSLRCMPRDGKLPLSFAQERLWFLDQLKPGSAVYNIPCAMRVRGPLNSTALEQSLREVVRRHEVLRTTIAAGGGTPEQVVMAEAVFHLELLDLRNVSETERES